ncbi:IucA/IucC family protein [Aquimarina muelleri]|uniref:Siderophore biosynthetic enzyme n=1 Tax=Aquimarina muelleri TaxID=279356 RepID=A0A918JX87_9FLAO|nr:IucA/IucC family protein [Aquimarina muelleri]MCX2763249.1 IucA/IucC family siderophore biosynthesis protein [Aquimarina muelleri]GGX27687.1 siderophore biosynthetic enzyme [Aquimarina muelleri]
MTAKPLNSTVFPDEKIWKKVNINLLAKSLSELMHEQVAKPEVINVDDKNITHFILHTDSKSIYYTFSAEARMLDYWYVHKNTIKKYENGKLNQRINVPEFFIENQKSFSIQPFTMAHYTEELLNTLYADASILLRGRLNVEALAEADYQTIEHQMDGHPWVIVNKSRIGFNHSDYKNYAPESDKNVKLIWIAAHKSRASFNSLQTIDQDQFYKEELGKEKLNIFYQILLDKKVEVKDYMFIPVHEWQWTNKLIMQFTSEIVEKKIIPMGLSDDIFSPQQSIRTFFNISDSKKHYTKTAISILSTGNIRGLSPKQMNIAPKVTQWVSDILNNDSYLQNTGLILLGEIATVSYLHPQYSTIKEVPYQYNEMLGVLWRESADKYLKPGEKLMTMAALLYVDDNEKSLVDELICKSGLTKEQWVDAYLQAYLKPLLHIYYKHSLCVTPHGENIIIVMKNYIPQRIVIKDFVDDIVVTSEAIENLPKDLSDGLIQSSNKENIPLFILIGVFDAYFRYLSNVLQVYSGYNENTFWENVTDVIIEYQQEHPDLNWKFDKYDIFTPEFKKFYINSSRLHQGYEERTGFVIPKKGGKLENPLALIKQVEPKYS